MVSEHYTHPDPAVRELIARHVAAALKEAAEDLRTEAAEAWGGDASWLTTGARVANLAAEWIDPGP